MRAMLPANQAALLGTVIMPRDFLEITVRDRATGEAVVERMWSDLYATLADVVDPDTGSAFTASWQGAAGLVSTDDVPFVSDLTVQEIEVAFVAYGVDTDRIFRLYDPKHAKVRIWRGFLNVDTGAMVAPAEILFIGEVDDIQLPTGADGEEATARLICLSSQELTRANPESRSDASQRLRNPGDGFFSYAASVSEWTIWWGQAKGTIETDPAQGRAAAAAEQLRAIQ